MVVKTTPLPSWPRCRTPQLDVGLLKLLEKVKTKVKDLEMIKMVEAAYVKLKDHLWYLIERLVPLALLAPGWQIVMKR